MSDQTKCPECGEPMVKELKTGNIMHVRIFKCDSAQLHNGEWVHHNACATIQALKSDNEAKDLRIKKLEFMIENGLGWEDLENDVTYP